MKKLLCAAAIGAGVMWFFDPANGPQRRDWLMQKLDSSQPGQRDSAPRLTATESAPQDDLTAYAAR